VVLINFEYGVEGELLETHHFGHEFVDSGIAHDSEMAEVVVVCLEKHGSLLYALRQLYHSQQIVLCEFASAFVVDVYPAHAVSVEVGGSVAGTVHFGLPFGLLGGEGERSERGVEGSGVRVGTERGEDESSDHYYHY
jgi:hypothetical protein